MKSAALTGSISARRCRGLGNDGGELVEALDRDPIAACVAAAPRRNQLIEERAPAGRRLLCSNETGEQQGIVQLVGGIRRGPGFLAHALDRRRVERAQVVGAPRLGRAPRVYGAGTPLLERRVVQKRV